MSAPTDLTTAERHLGWAAESLQLAGREASDATAKGALAAALADVEHLRQRVGRILSYTTTNEARRG